jgi:hypothetical protein
MNGTTFLASFEEILEVFFGAGCEDDGAVQLASSISFLTLVKTSVLYPKWCRGGRLKQTQFLHGFELYIL